MSPLYDQSPEVVKNIRRPTCRKFFTKDMIRILLEGLWGEVSTAKLGRHEEAVACFDQFLEIDSQKIVT